MSVCDGCEKKRLGCEFVCDRRELERFEKIKASGEFFSHYASHGKHWTDYRKYYNGGKPNDCKW